MLQIYKASAGSGKTYKLTQQYLTLLLGTKDKTTGAWKLNERPTSANRHILAVTFTNKATEEMMKRIISELAILAGREPGCDKKSDYLADFIELFATTEQRLRKLASDTLDELLADFLYFHVSTIDAFFQNVLRTFAREIEMPDNFELELDNRSTISVGVGEMLGSINRPEPVDPLKKQEYRWLCEWLNRYVDEKLDDGGALNLFSRSSSMFGDLVNTFRLIMDENFKIHFDEISNYFEDLNRLVKFKVKLRDYDSRVRYINAAVVRAKQYGDYGSLKLVTKFIDNWASPETIPAKNSDSTAKFLANPESYIRAKHTVSDEFRSLMLDIFTKIQEYYDCCKRDKMIARSLSYFGLMGFLLRIIQSYCKDNNLILLSETNSLLRDIINDDDAPFVYERIGYYLRHYLIDEFQDTSKMQWQNLRPLVNESLSNDNDNLIIGDEKQCIYRFRNSDPQLLGSTVHSQVSRVFGPDSVNIEGARVEQNNNWRSSREVVMFNNSIFRALSDIVVEGDPTFANVVQQISPKRKKLIPGHVKLLIEQETVEQQPETADDDAESSGAVSEFALSNMEKEVERLLNAGYRQADIAILVQKHREGEAVISRLLAMHEKPGWKHGRLEVTSVDSVGVAASSAVRMVVQILRLTQVPHLIECVEIKADGSENKVNEVNAAYRRARLLYCYEYFLHSPAVDESGRKNYPTPSEALDKAINLLRGDNKPSAPVNSGQFESGDSSLDKILNLDPQSLTGSRMSNPSKGKITCASLSTIIDTILSDYINPAIVSAETAYIAAFQDLVYDFCSRGSADISSFLAWWDRGGKNASLSSTEESRAITVTTIHQSKGLEYPCVIIPNANFQFLRHSSSYNRVYEWFDLDPADFPSCDPSTVPPCIPLDFVQGLGKIDAFKEQYESYANQKKIDALNLAYVAFTRAVNELVVISALPGKKNEFNLHDYLDAAVNRLTEHYLADPATDPEEAKWMLPLSLCSPSAGVYEVGEPTSPLPSAGSVEKKPDYASQPMPDYDPWVNDRVNTFTVADCHTFDFSDPRMRGDFLHRILSRVYRSSDLDLEIYRAAVRSHLAPDQTRYCAEILSEALADPRVEPWFNGYSRVVLERTLVGDNIDRRPDRIVWTADGHVDLIDYKFGDPHPSYEKQLRNYARLLARAGYTRVRAFLWYVTSRQIVRVST